MSPCGLAMDQRIYAIHVDNAVPDKPVSLSRRTVVLCVWNEWTTHRPDSIVGSSPSDKVEHDPPLIGSSKGGARSSRHDRLSDDDLAFPALAVR
jgi:hypothetical protein